jgi:hypothetical protein
VKGVTRDEGRDAEKKVEKEREKEVLMKREDKPETRAKLFLMLNMLIVRWWIESLRRDVSP